MLKALSRALLQGSALAAPAGRAGAHAWRRSSSSTAGGGEQSGASGGEQAAAVAAAGPPDDPERSAVVSEVAGLLRRLGLTPGSNCVLGDGLAVVDVGVLVGDPATQVAIDVETDISSEGRGAIMAKQRLLAHLGWRSACIRADDWRQLGGDPERQRRFLAAVIGVAVEGGSGDGGHGHGHGHVCGSGCSH